jgi:hypothetical protein
MAFTGPKPVHGAGRGTIEMIKYANIARSERLQRLAMYLSDYDWHSTRDIIRGANICAVNSAVSELRRNGYTVDTRWATTADARVCYYRIDPITSEAIA